MKTLYDKVWDSHVVHSVPNGPDVLFIDSHFIHEVTSPIAFRNLELRGIPVKFPNRTFATADHNTPTLNQHLPVRDPLSSKQLIELKKNALKYGITHWGLGHKKNGIVHVIGPENGITQPGKTIVCGDSHTSTHGAFGTIAFGIGTSEVEMVLATQCVVQEKSKTMRITINGKLPDLVFPKDVILHIVSKLSSGGATGYFVEYAGNVFSEMSMEGRMTVCNMSIEMGARGGMIAPDEKAFAYIKGKDYAPKGKEWEGKLAYWQQSLHSDNDAVFDKEISFNAEDIRPMITYGTNPGMGIPVDGKIPICSEIEGNEETFRKSLEYMGFREGESLIGKKIDYVFLGSCTNGRIEDFRAFAQAVKGRKKAKHITAWLVPGSHEVEDQIRKEGIFDILNDSGFQLRQPGCSACLAMNEDKVPAGKYVVSSSNRNFEGRQGPGARTLLTSPYMVGVTATSGIIKYPY